MDISARITGDKDVERMFIELPASAQNRVLKPVVGKSGAMLSDAIKSEAPSDSGLLKKAIGISKVRVYGAGSVFVATGVRRGFRRVISTTATGKLRIRSAKVSAQTTDGKWRNPIKYLHLVTGGRKAVTAIHKKVLYDSFHNRVLGKSVASVSPNPFIERAFASAASKVVAMIESEATDKIIAEAAKLSSANQ